MHVKCIYKKEFVTSYLKKRIFLSFNTEGFADSVLCVDIKQKLFHLKV